MQEIKEIQKMIDAKSREGSDLITFHNLISGEEFTIQEKALRQTCAEKGLDYSGMMKVKKGKSAYKKWIRKKP